MAKLIDTGDLAPEVLESSKELLEAVDLVNVRLAGFSAVRQDGSAPPARVDVEFAPGFAASQGKYANKFEWIVRLVGDKEEQVAELRATFIVDYRVPKDFTPDPAAADHVATTTGYLAAYPYAREFFESATARLQLDPLVFGLLRMSDLNPRSVAIVRPAQAEVQ